MSFTIGSLFDGSGGFPLAATLSGGTPRWSSEIEPYPIAVTKSRFPGIKHLGSVTDIKGGEVEPVDVITFGSPCQDLSVAGKRAGLKHTDNGDDETTRSGLFMEAVRIIKEMREATNGVYPRFALWENVPGAFSSNKGEDFRIVLEELIKVVEPTAVMPAVPKNGWPYADSYCGDGWSIAYRVLDAQFWGVPQRRRRIYLVADFRGECAGKVSFEREGLRGYFAESGTPWQTAAGDAENCPGAADCERNGVNVLNPWDSQGNQVHDGTGSNIYPCLRGCGGAGYQAGYVFALDQQGGKGGANFAENVMPTLCSDSHGTPHAVAYSFDALSSNSMKSSNPHSGCRQVEIAKCLDTTDPNPSKNQGGIAVLEPIPYTMKIRSGCEGGGKGALIQTDKSVTLSTLNDQYLFQPIGFDVYNQAVTGDVTKSLTAIKSDADHVPVVCMATQQGGAEIMEDKCPTITAAAGMSGNNQPVVCYSDMVLDDQGGSQISVRDDGKCPTLRAEMHGNVPSVMEPVVTLEPGIAAREGGHVYEGVSGTLRANAGDNQMAVAYSIENHPADSRVNIDDSGKVQTLTSRMGTGGGNVPMVMEPVTFDARGNGDGKTASTITGCHEAFVSDFTSIVVEPKVYESHPMDSRIKELDGVAPTVSVKWHKGAADTPLVCEPKTVAIEGNGSRPSHKGDGYAESDVMYTLNATEQHGVAYSMETFHCTSEEEKVQTLKARDWKDPNVVVYIEDQPTSVAYSMKSISRNGNPLTEQANPICASDYKDPDIVAYPPDGIRYIVRRLTPTECARLQGFPDTWGHPIIKEDLTDDEYQFWLKVRNTHAAINDKTTKEYTKEQILKWYNGLHTDSSEYKMWGNGIALPNALYMMQGIADVMSEEKAARKRWLDDLLK